MTLPKVLIIGQSFCEFRGGGITMMNLFSQWEKEKLAVACTGHHLNLKINTSICDTYYQLGEKEHKMIFPFNILQKKFESGPVKFITTPNKDNYVKQNLRKRFVDKILYPFLEYVGLINIISEIKLSDQFCEWLIAYNPDVIYAQAYSLEGVKFGIAIQEYLKKPMAFHMMDDWPSSSSSKGLFKFSWQKKIDNNFRKLLEKSSLLLSIGEDMSEEYMHRYGKSFVPFHNPIDVDHWKKYQKKNYELNNKPFVLYSGRIGLGIDSSLKLIAEAIERLNEELPVKLRFVLSSEEKPAWINEFPSSEYRSFVDYEYVPKSLAEADILILPYDFSNESIKFMRYSMPTKASEYMMSGTPVILFAPPDTAITNYAYRYECFKINTTNNIDDLLVSIKSLVEDLSSRQQLAKRAIFIAEKNHDLELIALNFKSALCSLIR